MALAVHRSIACMLRIAHKLSEKKRTIRNAHEMVIVGVSCAKGSNL